MYLLVLASPLWALSDGMYSASVKVQSQSVSERNRAAQEGLRQVLVRASGITDLEQSKELPRVLANASRYMDQFQYQNNVDEYGDRVEQLMMSFTPAVIERVLQQAQLPLWPTNRPNVLVWLVADDADSGRRLVNDSEDEVVKGLLKGAAERGLRLKWPLLDLEDQLAIAADDVWTFEQDKILEASERYKVDTVLVGRYTQTSKGEWWTSWQFFHRGEQRFYDLRVEEGAAAGQQAMAPVADYLAGLYSVFYGAEGQPQLQIQISQIKDFAAFRGALNYLQQVAVVTSYQLLAVTGSTLLLSAQLNGDVQQLENAMSLDNKLRLEVVEHPAADAPWIAVPSGTASNPLQLKWIGG